VLQLSDGHRAALPLLVGLVEALERRLVELDGKGEQGAGGAAAGANGGSPQGAGGGGGKGEEEEGSEGEAMEAPAELLGLLTLTQSLPGHQGAADGGGAGGGGTGAADAAAADARAFGQAAAAAGAVLKAVANSPSCSADVWGLLGRWYALQGEPLPAKEALLKQVRALQGGQYARERPAFEAMAEASLHMADAYLKLAASGQGGPRDLAAARMHLRGVVRQAEAEFGGEELFGQLRAKLEEVEAQEAVFKAAVQAA
jgi:hypothetical protein